MKNKKDYNIRVLFVLVLLLNLYKAFAFNDLQTEQVISASINETTNIETKYLSEENYASLEINEVQVSNIDQYIDYSFNYGGWIELYNRSDEPILLDGLYVSDELSNPQKFMLPNDFGTIDAKGYKVIFFGNNSSDGNYGSTAYKQVNFKLENDGGTIFIADVDGEIISSVNYPSAIARCSYARIGDSADEWGMTGEPTPGYSNISSTFATERLSAPEVDTDSRLITSQITVKVFIPDGATLRYTTDCSTPTLTNGLTSEDGIFQISETQNLRFRLFKDGYLPSQVITRSYIQRDKDYYLPIISIVTAYENLYDDSIGVYVDGKNGIAGNNHTKSNLNMDWKRPVNFEYITSDNEMVVSMETEFEVSGGWSRHYAPASFKIKATKNYEGLNSIDYQFFSLKPYNKYKEILIRNGGNDNVDAEHGRVRDAITQNILMTSGVYVDAQDYQPTHVFINGEYIGMLNLREPNNRYHGTANYGYDDDEMDAFEYSDGGYQQKAGTNDYFNYWLNLSMSATDDDVYNTMCQDVVDMDEFINYWAACCYIGSNDWITGNNNLKGYREIPNGRFHLTMLDEDQGWISSNMVADVNDNYKNGMLTIYNNLKQNPSFHRQFIDAYCIMNGSVFTSNRCKTIGDSICNLVEKALAMENRQPWTSYSEQYDNMTSTSSRKRRMDALKESYNLGQGMQISFSGNVPSVAFLLNSQPVPTGEFSGTLFAPVKIEATASAEYNFIGWQRADLSDSPIISTERTLLLDSDIDMELVALFRPVADEMKIAAGSPCVVINEISASNSIFVNDYIKRNDWIELYNTTDETVDVEGMYLTDNLSKPTKYQISSSDSQASTLIPPHGYLIVWADKSDPITQLHSNFNLGNDDGEVVMLMANDMSWTDTLTYVSHQGEESVGRYPDGGKRVYKMSKPTIGASNWINTYAEWIYGEDNNYDDGLGTSINTEILQGDILRKEYYSVDGTRLKYLRNGVNIIREFFDNGTSSTRKILK